MDALQNLFGVENNQVLIRKNEIIDTVFRRIFSIRIKQPGIYTIHFDLIRPRSFSFELHTRDEIIHFSEHNPKHDINLKKGENCLLVLKIAPGFIRPGSKIYAYYNI